MINDTNKINDIQIELSKFLNISIEDCLNKDVIGRMETYAKEIAHIVIERGRDNHNFDSLESNAKVEYFLSHTLIELVSTQKWAKFIETTEYSTESIYDSIYISLKKQYYKILNEFPV